MRKKQVLLPTIILVDDHLIFREGLKTILTLGGIAKVIGEASNGLDFLKLLVNQKPDLVFMDIDMPLMGGMEATQKALEIFPDLKIIALTMFSDGEYYYKMIDLGVKGFILKTNGSEDIEEGIKEVMLGKGYFSNEILREIISQLGRKTTTIVNKLPNFSARELEILKKISKGDTTDEIAKALFISSKTVKTHRSNLLEKTASKNTACMMLYAISNKIINLEEITQEKILIKN
jgi:DNA-binding NarL/FixJ family response regulator